MCESEKKKNYDPALAELCKKIRVLIEAQKYGECTGPIREAMREYPHAPHPHNLMGILLEATGDHPGSMKHFRAAWALDPGYLPCRINLDRYGTFFTQGPCAFDEHDCPPEDEYLHYKIYYDDDGIGRLERQE